MIYTKIESLTQAGRDRNLGIEYLVIYGIMTDQCVECAIREAADRGFLVTQACTAEDPKRHATSLEAMRGHYCRTRTPIKWLTKSDHFFES